MSVKAKIEAVVYAAAEPVTLAQLAALFGEEALREGQPENPSSFDFASEANTASPDPRQTDSDSEDESAQPELVEARAPQSAASSDTGAEARQAARAREREAKAAVAEIVRDLIAGYAADDRGLEIREIAGGFRMATRPEVHDAVRVFVKSLKPQMKLSLQSLETLAVVAYKQPITAPEISEIRGVDASGVLGGLMARKLIATAGRKQVIGRPILYKTTKEFLLRFGLKDIGELPSMEEFENLAAGLAEEAETEEAEEETPDRAVHENSLRESSKAAEPVVAEAGQDEPGGDSLREQP